MLTHLPPSMHPGRIEPLGAQARDGGVNFAVFSDHAQRIEVCIFDASGSRELRRYDLHGPQDGLWHGFLPGLGPGLVYGLRAHGPYAPHEGHRFNPHKLLLDPWAREIVGHFSWRSEHHGYELGHPDGPRSFDTRDNAAHALKARVAPASGPAPGWHNAPRHADADVVLYEVHVKSFSMTHPDIPADLRGTYAALAHPASIAHFKRLGVTTLSLLPVHYHLDEAFLAAKGLVNHWGYNTIGFFCPDPRYARRGSDSSAVNEEFRQMVATLHAHGLEVVLDVVYNHTAEGHEMGPTLSQRGLDHKSWYHLQSDDLSRCENFTGCGNSVNVFHPRVMQWVLDSLRYWVHDMGVDGFRFDLATVLGRTHPRFDPQAPFFVALAQDPVLARARLIAEAWDSGPDGYQVGHFPLRWQEWNDKFRDGARRYWLHWAEMSALASAPADSAPSPGHTPSPAARAGALSRGEFARRFCASSDLFHHRRRRPTASINFISAHDGFTLADFTSHSRKHNHGNGEDNRDGRDNELCAALGAEGLSNDRSIQTRRERVRRALLATLLLAQGTPMLWSGDEIGHSQAGNNNAWNQDNATSWLNWAQADTGLCDFVGQVSALRRAEPALRHDRWFTSEPAGPGDRSLVWSTPGGAPMHHHDWHHGQEGAFACRIDGATVPDPGAPTAHAGSAHLWLAFNPEAGDVEFVLPELAGDAGWTVALDSALHWSVGHPVSHRLRVAAFSVVVLRHTATSNR